MRRIRIGFHGVPGAGKTVLQAMLYGFRDVEDGCILFTDAPTIQYLRPRWQQIRDQRTPAASAMGKPDRLLWSIKTDVVEWEIEALDFAGALVDPGTNDGIATHLSHEVNTFLAGCDGLFLLVDPSDPDPRQLDALAILLDHLRAHSPTENGGIRRPVGLLLTKFDKLGPLDADSLANQQRALECLRGHPILKLIRDLLADRQEGAWWFQVFPVSAFGAPCKDGKAPSRDKLKPYNVHKSLRWLVAEADAELIRLQSERIRRQWRNLVISVVATSIVLIATLLGVRWRTAFLETRRLEWDRNAWVKAKAADLPSVTDFEEVRNLYRDWLQVPGTEAARRDQANAAITRLEDAWDRGQYAQIYEAAEAGKAGSDWKKFDDALVLAKAYDGADRGIKRMSVPVKGLLQWAQGIQSGGVFCHIFVLVAPDIPELRWRIWPELFIVLHRDDGWTSDTRWKGVKYPADAKNYDLGNIPIKWGRALRVQGQLEMIDNFYHNAWGKIEFTPSFKSTTADQRTVGAAMGGKKDLMTILGWECIGLEPPALMPYGK